MWPDDSRRLDRDEEALRAAAIGELRGRTTWVRPPCCGRRKKPADTVLNVPGEGWLCDVCRRQIERDPDTEWTRPKLMRALGAPPEEVRGERVKELTREKLREIKRSDPESAIGREWRDANGLINRNAVARRIERDVRSKSGGYPPGTELPSHVSPGLDTRSDE